MFTCWSCSGFLWTSLASSSKLQSCWNRVRDVPPAPWKAATTSWLVRLLLTWNKLWSFFLKRMNHNSGALFLQNDRTKIIRKPSYRLILSTCHHFILSFISFQSSSVALAVSAVGSTCHIILHLLLCKSPAPRNVAISMLVEPTPEPMRNPSKPHGNAPGMWITVQLFLFCNVFKWISLKPLKLLLWLLWGSWTVGLQFW